MLFSSVKNLCLQLINTAKVKKLCLQLVDKAKQLGLSENICMEAKEYIFYNEFEICFDMIAQQIYEFDIAVDEDFLNTVFLLVEKMGLDKNEYTFLIKN